MIRKDPMTDLRYLGLLQPRKTLFQGLSIPLISCSFFLETFGKIKPYNFPRVHHGSATKNECFLAISNKRFPYQADDSSFRCQLYNCPVAIAAKDGH